MCYVTYRDHRWTDNQPQILRLVRVIQVSVGGEIWQYRDG
jgi:hypothetical protein